MTLRLRMLTTACIFAASSVLVADEPDLISQKLMVVRPMAELKAEEAVVGRVPLGTLLTADRAEGNWLWIDSHQGWIRQADVLPADKAIAQFTAAIEKQPTSEAYHQRGVAYDGLGQLDKALADFEQALRLDPKNSAAWNNRGNIWQKKGEDEKAFADYTTALRHDPNNAAAWNNRSALQAKRGDLRQAMRDVERALHLNPQYAEAYNNRGVTWRQQGEFDKAIADYDEAIKLAPGYALAYGNRGYGWKQKGNYEQAIKDYTVALHLAPELPATHNDLAWLLATCPDEKYRDGSRALEHARKAVELTGGDDWNTLDTLAAAQAEAGDFDGAVETIRKAMKLAPEDARTNLAEKERLYEALMAFRDTPK